MTSCSEIKVADMNSGQRAFDCVRSFATKTLEAPAIIGIDILGVSSFIIELEGGGGTGCTAAPTIHDSIIEFAEFQGKKSRYPSLRFVASASVAMSADLVVGLGRLFDVPVLDDCDLIETSWHGMSNWLRHSGLTKISNRAPRENKCLEAGVE